MRSLTPLSISAERDRADRAGSRGSHQRLKASGLQAAPLWGLKAGVAEWLPFGVGRLGLSGFQIGSGGERYRGASPARILFLSFSSKASSNGPYCKGGE